MQADLHTTNQGNIILDAFSGIHSTSDAKIWADRGVLLKTFGNVGSFDAKLMIKHGAYGFIV